ncbi:hypothetical protein UlMin_002187 [Ulmus minor]
MAAVANMQSTLLSSSLTCGASRTTRANLVPSSLDFPRFSRNSRTTVRCMAEDGDKEEQPTTPVSKSPLQSEPTISSPSPKPKVSPKFSELFAFGGPAPERINGRLAMVGFVAALAVEISKGQDVFAQISDGGIPWFLATSVLLSVASLIPLLKGVSAESKSDGFMTSDAEIWNGRFAMLGLVALAFTEFVKGGTLV